MKSTKEVVLFTQDKTYCIKNDCTLDKINKKKTKLYGCMTGLSVIPYKFPKHATDVEIRNRFHRTIDFSDFILLTKIVGENKYGFAVNKEIAFSTYKENSLMYFTIADIVLLNAYWDYVGKDKFTVIGYLDAINEMLVYQIVGHNMIYQVLQRKSINVDIYQTSEINREKVISTAKTELESLILTEEERTGEKMDYVIAGINDDFDAIYYATLNTPSKESLHNNFIDKKGILYKKSALALISAGVVFDIMLFPQYFALQRQSATMDKKINRIQNYIQREDSVIKELYKEKGKTIVLQDRIDISKISRILNDINILPPGKIVYKNEKNDIVVDMTYVHNNILAQKYAQILRKNKKIKVTFFINPTFDISRIHVVIPKEVIR